MAVLEVTSRQFRDNQKAFFDLADAGKQIVIRRGRKKSYVLTPVEENDLYFTPQMLEKIDRALAQVEHGEMVSTKTYEESIKFLDSL